MKATAHRPLFWGIPLRYLFCLVLLSGALLLTVNFARAAAPAQQSDEPTTYTVQPGDTLTAIANRYGMTVEELLDLNGLSDRDFVYVGQDLLVIEVGTDEATADETTSDEATGDEASGDDAITADEDTTTEDTTTEDTTAEESADAATIDPTTEEQAAEEPQTVTPEPTEEPTAAPTSTPTAIPTATATSEPVPTTTYTVRVGDNLFRIARDFNTTVDELLALNGLRNADYVYVGQDLIVPALDEAETAEESATEETTEETTDAEPTAAPDDTTPVATPTTDTSQEIEPIPTPTPTPEPEPILTVYTVRPGDNMSTIAQRFETTTAELLRLNGLGNADYVYVGQRLRVPIVQDGTPTSDEATRVNFAAGSTSATVSGTAIFPEQTCYILDASAGQEMTVSITSDGNLANFSVRAADAAVNSGVALKRLENEERRWRSPLPVTGDYFVCVATPEGAAIYELTFSIPVACTSVTQAVQTVNWETFLPGDAALTHEVIGDDDYVTVISDVVSETITVNGIPQLDQIAYGDFDGDCEEEAGIPLFSGGTAGNVGYLVYDEQTRTDGVTTPILVAAGGGYKLAVAADAGIFVVSNALYNGWEPNCCPSGRAYDSYRLEEGALVQVAASSEGYAEAQVPTVQYFYQLLQEERFTEAYALLSETLQTANPYESWVAGYEQTEAIEATLEPDPDTPNRLNADLRVTERLESGAARIRHYTGYWDLAWDGTFPGWILQDGNFTIVP